MVAALLAAATLVLPAGSYEVVAVRRASDTASTLAMQSDDALARSLGKRLTIGDSLRWYDDRACLGSAKLAPSAGLVINLEDPNLSDLKPAAGPTSRSLVVDCGARP